MMCGERKLGQPLPWKRVTQLTSTPEDLHDIVSICEYEIKWR